MQKLYLFLILLCPIISAAQDYYTYSYNSKLAITADQMIREMLVPSESVSTAFDLMEREGAQIERSRLNEILLRRQLAETTIFKAGNVYELTEPQVEKAIGEMLKQTGYDSNESRTLYANSKTGIRISLTNWNKADALKIVFEHMSIGQGPYKDNRTLASKHFKQIQNLATDVVTQVQNITGNSRSLEVLPTSYTNLSKVNAIRDTTPTGKQFTVNHAQVELYVQGTDMNRMRGGHSQRAEFVKEMSKNLLPTLDEVKKQSSHLTVNSTLRKLTANINARVKRMAREAMSTKTDRAIKKGAKK